MPSSPPLNQNGNDVDDTVEELENLIGDSYNNVNLSGAGTDLEFYTPNGGTTAVKSITLPSGGGGGSNFEAFNSVSESNGVYTFGTNHGNSIATTIDIGGITTNSANISGLSTTVGTHTTAIDDVEAAIETQVGIEVPFNFPEFDMTSNTTTVNGVTYIASGSNSNPWEGFSTSGKYESSSYETLIGTRFDYGGSEGDSGSYDYAGTENLGTGAVDGSWLKLQLPEPRAVSGFKIRNFDNEEDCVLGWNIYGSSNDSDWTLLGSYLTNHKNKPTHSAGGNTYELDATLAGYGQLYSYYAIVFTRVFGGEFWTKAKGKLREIRFIGGTRLAAHVGAVIRTNTLNISTLEQRDKFKDIHEHPDLHDECYLAHLHDNNKSLTVNGRTYTFTSSSHTEYPRHYEYYAFMDQTGTGTSEELWESDGNTYNTVDAGGYYRNYSGSASLGGISGEWLQVKLPEPILLNSFRLRSCPVADGGMPRSFTIIASNDGTNYDTIQSYSDVSVSNTAETLFQINSTASNYGNKYSYYAIVTTKIDPNPWGTVHFKSVQIRRWRLFSVNDDVADCIKRTDESFNNATITGTNTLNLISDSGTTSLTLPGGTTAATSVDAITINIDITGSDYTIQGIANMPLELLYGHKYIINYPSLHPLKFSTTEDGTHNGGTESTQGRTDTITTPAAAVGVFWQFEFKNVALEHFYYYCSSHSGMGGHVFAANGKNNIKQNGFTYDTSVSPPKIIIERESGISTQELNLSDSFVQAQKDGDNIKLTTISGAQTTVGPFSAGGTGLTTTTNYPTTAMTSNALPSPFVASASTAHNPAYYAFDGIATTEWVSNSNIYNSATGGYVGLNKLASSTDAGEYLKIDLGSALQATSLNLKSSIAEIKEPSITMTNYNQSGYEVTVSSEATSGLNPGYLVFNNLTTPVSDRWIAAPGKYDPTSGSYNASARLSTDYPSTGTNPQTAAGEYLMIKLPGKRKLVAYKLTREDGTFWQFSPQDFTLYARETNTSDWVNLSSESLTTSTLIGNASTGGGTRYPSTGDFTPTTGYQYFALVVTALWASNHQTFALSEFELFCQPSEIDEFKLYGSPDDAAWIEIHAQTSANITSSGTEFQITNPGSYQHYGLVITKTKNYHNVSLGEIKIGVTESVDLSNYYTIPEVDSLIPTIPTIPKGVSAEGSFNYVANNSSTFAVAQASFFAASPNIGWTSSNVTVQTWHFGNPIYWSQAPECTQIIYKFGFTSPILDDAGQETSEYKVMLTKRDIVHSHHSTIYDLAVYDKAPDYFKVRVEIEVSSSNYHIKDHGFDLMVF